MVAYLPVSVPRRNIVQLLAQLVHAVRPGLLARLNLAFDFRQVRIAQRILSATARLRRISHGGKPGVPPVFQPLQLRGVLSSRVFN